jgi:membrane dipeptidase
MFVADLHNDVVQRAMIGEDIAQRTDVGHSDLVRLRESCIDLEILVVWASKAPPEGSAFVIANAMYDAIEALAKKNDFLTIPKTLNDIAISKKNNQLSIPIAMEGGEALENSLEKLHHFIERGVFYLGPTWNYSLDWVSSGYDEVHNKKNIKHFGLSKFGQEVIHTCNDNGVMIDVSHVGEKSFWYCKKVIFCC